MDVIGLITGFNTFYNNINFFKYLGKIGLSNSSLILDEDGLSSGVGVSVGDDIGIIHQSTSI